MTTVDELCEAIATVGVPWTNAELGRGDEDFAPPYIVIRKSGGFTSGANDMTWCAIAEYDIELYTIHRNYGLERTVTDALDEAGIYYSDGGNWPLDTEGLFEAVMTVTVREN